MLDNWFVISFLTTFERHKPSRNLSTKMQQRNNNGSMNACSLFSIFLPPSERCSLNDQSFFSKEKTGLSRTLKFCTEKPFHFHPQRASCIIYSSSKKLPFDLRAFFISNFVNAVVSRKLCNIFLFYLAKVVLQIKGS